MLDLECDRNSLHVLNEWSLHILGTMLNEFGALHIAMFSCVCRGPVYTDTTSRYLPCSPVSAGVRCTQTQPPGICHVLLCLPVSGVHRHNLPVFVMFSRACRGPVYTDTTSRYLPCSPVSAGVRCTQTQPAGICHVLLCLPGSGVHRHNLPVFVMFSCVCRGPVYTDTTSRYLPCSPVSAGVRCTQTQPAGICHVLLCLPGSGVHRHNLPVFVMFSCVCRGPVYTDTTSRYLPCSPVSAGVRCTQTQPPGICHVLLCLPGSGVHRHNLPVFVMFSCVCRGPVYTDTTCRYLPCSPVSAGVRCTQTQPPGICHVLLCLPGSGVHRHNLPVFAMFSCVCRGPVYTDTTCRYLPCSPVSAGVRCTQTQPAGICHVLLCLPGSGVHRHNLPVFAMFSCVCRGPVYTDTTCRYLSCSPVSAGVRCTQTQPAGICHVLLCLPGSGVHRHNLPVFAMFSCVCGVRCTQTQPPGICHVLLCLPGSGVHRHNLLVFVMFSCVCRGPVYTDTTSRYLSCSPVSAGSGVHRHNLPVFVMFSCVCRGPVYTDTTSRYLACSPVSAGVRCTQTQPPGICHVLPCLPGSGVHRHNLPVFVMFSCVCRCPVYTDTTCRYLPCSPVSAGVRSTQTQPPGICHVLLCLPGSGVHRHNLPVFAMFSRVCRGPVYTDTTCRYLSCSPVSAGVRCTQTQPAGICHVLLCLPVSGVHRHNLPVFVMFSCVCRGPVYTDTTSRYLPCSPVPAGVRCTQTQPPGICHVLLCLPGSGVHRHNLPVFAMFSCVCRCPVYTDTTSRYLSCSPVSAGVRCTQTQRLSYLPCSLLCSNTSTCAVLNDVCICVFF